jgi:hypothetical protein
LYGMLKIWSPECTRRTLGPFAIVAHLPKILLPQKDPVPPLLLPIICQKAAIVLDLAAPVQIWLHGMALTNKQYDQLRFHRYQF